MNAPNAPTRKNSHQNTENEENEKSKDTKNGWKSTFKTRTFIRPVQHHFLLTGTATWGEIDGSRIKDPNVRVVLRFGTRPSINSGLFVCERLRNV